MVRDQVQSICANQLISVPMNCMLAVSIGFIANGYISHNVLAMWVAAVLALNTVRFCAAYRQVKRSLETASPYRVRRIQGLLLLSTGMIWAFVPAVMLDMARPQAASILFILAGLSAGATVQAGTYSLGAMAFVFPMFGILIATLVISGAANCYMLAFDATLYLALLFASSRKSEKALFKTLSLRIEATALAASLDEEHKASKAAATRFFELANHDPLTGLANRAAFASSLNLWLDRARGEGGAFYLLLLDLDNFKSINDTLGHSAGDEILKEVARRLSSTIEGEHLVARLGGDEFSVLLACPAGSAGDRENVGRVADHILKNVSGVHNLGEHAISIGVSLGIAEFPDDGVSAEDLLAHADLALYAAKDSGRHRWRHFDAALLADATMARQIEHDLPHALATGALQVFFQPQVALSDYRLVGLEALLRWNHPVHGWVPPPTIVVAARRIRACDLLTTFILDEACRQVRRLQSRGIADALVAINIPPSELVSLDLPDMIRRATTAHGIECRHLEVEITEEAFAANENALTTLAALSAMGVRLAIDDFGTGYSSIAYLSTMRVDRIKIDRSFVSGFVDREGARILVKAILGIGRSLGIDVLAEGVETAEEALLLKSFGCATVQGFYFGRPLNQPALDAWLNARDDGSQTKGAIVGAQTSTIGSAGSLSAPLLSSPKAVGDRR